MNQHLAVMIAGYLAAGACSLLGCYLVLRKMSMVGDAISHAVLPGIVIAFLVSGSRASLPMMIGAGAVGLGATFLIESLNRYGRLQHDAAIGVVFTALFSLGVLLVSQYAGQVDLDLDCVLYGDILYTPLNTWMIGERDLGPRAIWILGGVFVVNLAFVALFWKELKITSFDPSLATTLGIGAAVLHYSLMSLVSLTTVAAFESVGAILVVAMLIVPAATAYLLTDRLGWMHAWAQLVALASATGGYAIGLWLDCSIAGAMTVVSGACFAAAFVLSPSHGLLGRFLAARAQA